MYLKIKEIAEKHLEYLKERFSISDVILHIEENPSKVIFENGVGGYTPDSNNIFLYFDSKNPNFEKDLELKIKSTITHEFNHAIRNRYFNWEEDTLLGAMITEGLADHFDIEVNGGEPKIWNTALSTEEIEEYLETAKEEFSSRDFDYGKWFFGSGYIPRWTGYSLGFYLVGNYLKENNKKASEVTNQKAEDFFKST